MTQLKNKPIIIRRFKLFEAIAQVSTFPLLLFLHDGFEMDSFLVVMYVIFVVGIIFCYFRAFSLYLSDDVLTLNKGVFHEGYSVKTSQIASISLDYLNTEPYKIELHSEFFGTKTVNFPEPKKEVLNLLKAHFNVTN